MRQDCHPFPQDGAIPKVSFEFFPPKTEKLERQLWQAVERLAPMAPAFVSVTYGAGGTTRERTHTLVNRVLTETDLVPAAHLTCVGASRAETDSVIESYWQAGVRHIVALRGDPPAGETGFTPHPDGYDGAVALIRGIKARHNFEVTVGCYPEPHPDSRGLAQDLDHLKAKVDAGATRAITQYFFGNELFLRFVDAARKAGVEIPIVPGILPVHNFGQLIKFSKMCGASVPSWLAQRFEGLENDPTTHNLIAAATAAEQCIGLKSEGIDLFHFYTLNRSDLVYAICHMLGLRPLPHAAARAA